MAETYDTLREAYLKQSEEFTELNKEYNRAVRADNVSDALELKFLRTERALHKAYRTMQELKAVEVADGKHKPKKVK